MHAAYALAQQAATLPTAAHNGDDWTGADDALLTNLRAHGVSIADCATQLNRTYYAVSTRIKLLGLAQARTIRTQASEAPCPSCWLVHVAECR